MNIFNVLELFVRCALFLRQAGLWEQLCMLIRLNLQLNLSDSAADHYKIDVQIPEDSVSKYSISILRNFHSSIILKYGAVQNMRPLLQDNSKTKYSRVVFPYTRCG